MKNKIKEILFFIDKIKFLKLKILLSSFIKFLVKISEIIVFISLLLFLEKSLFSHFLDTRRLIYVAIVYIFYLVIKFIDIYYSHYISYNVIEKLRDNIFEHYYRISPGAVEDIKVGDFIQMIVNDINVFEWFIAHILTEWISLLFLFVIMFYALVTKSVMASILFLALMIFIVRLFLSTVNKKEEQGIEIKTLGGDLLANVIDGILGFKELIFFNRDRDFFNKIELKSKKYNEVSAKYFIEETKVNLWIDILAILIIPMVIALLNIEGFEIILYAFAILLFYIIFRDCMYQTGNFGFIFGALNRLKQVYDIEPIVKKYGDMEINRADIKKGIEFIDCSFHYPKNTSNLILNKVCFKANKGEKTVIVSESGGGKSTIFKLINRFYELNNGEIKIFGKNLQDYTERTLRKNITTFSQNVFFFNDTVSNNFKYVREDVNVSEIENLSKKLNVYDFIQGKQKGFENIVSESGSNYSGGELQRLAILRGLIKDSPILLMDEVSSALDEKNEDMFNKVLDEIKENKVIIMAAHKLSTIKKADKIILLKDGKVIGEGKYEELLDNNYFKELLVVKNRGEGIEA